MIYQGQTSNGRAYQITEAYELSIPSLSLTSPIRWIQGARIVAGEVRYQGKRMQLMADVSGQDAAQISRLLDARKQAERAAHEAKPETQRVRLADAVADARERVAEHRDPDAAYPALRNAEAALAEWDAVNAEDATRIKAARKAEREQAEAEKQARIAQGFVAQGLD